MPGSRSSATRLIAFLATLGAFFGLTHSLIALLHKLRLSKSSMKLAQSRAFGAGAQQLRFIAFKPRHFRRHLTPHDARGRARAYIGVIVPQHQTDARRGCHEHLNTGYEKSLSNASAGVGLAIVPGWDGSSTFPIGDSVPVKVRRRR